MIQLLLNAWHLNLKAQEQKQTKPQEMIKLSQILAETGRRKEVEGEKGKKIGDES